MLKPKKEGVADESNKNDTERKQCKRYTRFSKRQIKLYLLLLVYLVIVVYAYYRFILFAKSYC